MATPARKSPVASFRVGARRTPAANRSIQRKVRASSAVSKTAGITVENEIVHSAKYSKPVNSSLPRYSQLRDRLLITSKSHQAGAELKNSQTKSRRDRLNMDVPLRSRTRASTVKAYPNQSGKNKYAVRLVLSGKSQFNGQNT